MYARIKITFFSLEDSFLVRKVKYSLELSKEKLLLVTRSKSLKSLDRVKCPFELTETGISDLGHLRYEKGLSINKKT